MAPPSQSLPADDVFRDRSLLPLPAAYRKLAGRNGMGLREKCRPVVPVVKNQGEDQSPSCNVPTAPQPRLRSTGASSASLAALLRISKSFHCTSKEVLASFAHRSGAPKNEIALPTRAPTNPARRLLAQCWKNQRVAHTKRFLLGSAEPNQAHWSLLRVGGNPSSIKG